MPASDAGLLRAFDFVAALVLAAALVLLAPREARAQVDPCDGLPDCNQTHTIKNVDGVAIGRVTLPDGSVVWRHNSNSFFSTELINALLNHPLYAGVPANVKADFAANFGGLSNLEFLTQNTGTGLLGMNARDAVIGSLQAAAGPGGATVGDVQHVSFEYELFGGSDGGSNGGTITIHTGEGTIELYLIDASHVPPDIPADSVQLQSLQKTVTKLVAQTSGQAISDAVDGAVADGFSDNDDEPTFAFAGDSMRLGFAMGASGPVGGPSSPWLPWLALRGTGWRSDPDDVGDGRDLRGRQFNALAGLTHRLGPGALAGAFGGYETFDYRWRSLNGRMTGDGWTVGGYGGWRFGDGLRADAALAHSWIDYDGRAGAAVGVFSGSRWHLSGGLAGRRAIGRFEIAPSARAHALWEREGGYTDSLGTAHASRRFSTGRASAGVKATHAGAWPDIWPGATIRPHAGLYADLYFSRDTMRPLAPGLAPPEEIVRGLALRPVAGVTASTASGAQLALDGELGGLGNAFRTWTLRARASVPF